MDLQLTDRVYYVSGGSRGVGRAVVELLLAEGARVVTCARSAAGLEQLRAGTGAGPDRLMTGVADVRDAERVRRHLTEAVDRYGRLDGLVANAGAGASGDVLGTPPEVWDEQFAVKVHSVLNLVRPAVPVLAGSDAGRIVVVNGVTGYAPEPTMAAVSAARAAVLNLSRSLAVALAPRGICVNVVNLGPISTDRQRARYDASGSTEPFDEWCRQDARRRGVLLGRLGRAEEVAPAVAFLLSPLASYLTASSVEVAGGLGARL